MHFSSMFRDIEDCSLGYLLITRQCCLVISTKAPAFFSSLNKFGEVLMHFFSPFRDIEDSPLQEIFRNSLFIQNGIKYCGYRPVRR